VSVALQINNTDRRNIVSLWPDFYTYWCNRLLDRKSLSDEKAGDQVGTYGENYIYAGKDEFSQAA